MTLHPLAGKTVLLKKLKNDAHNIGCQEFRVEDLWINVYGCSWMEAIGNPAACFYAMRAGLNHLPNDDNVLYGKVGSFSYLIHETEIEGG